MSSRITRKGTSPCLAPTADEKSDDAEFRQPLIIPRPSPICSPAPSSARWTTDSASERLTCSRCKPRRIGVWKLTGRRHWNRSRLRKPSAPCRYLRTHNGLLPNCSWSSKPQTDRGPRTRH